MKKRGVTFYCFSPPVMIATLIIESVLVVYTLVRYKMDILLRLVILILITLAVFQLSEYRVCTGLGINAVDWSRLGYAAITMLPPLGLHLLHIIAQKPRRRLVTVAYASMFLFIWYFLAYSIAFTGYQCTGNYVIFQIGVIPSLIYGAYYYGWLFIAIGLAAHWANQLHDVGSKKIHQLKAVKGMIVGYAVFLVPTAIVYTLNPAYRRGIPSIMCGFAVLFALILSLYVLPNAKSERRNR